MMDDRENQQILRVALDVAYWTAKVQKAKDDLDYAERRLKEAVVGVSSITSELSGLLATLDQG